MIREGGLKKIGRKLIAEQIREEGAGTPIYPLPSDLVGNTNEQTINRCGSNHAPSLSEQST
jgi:hypothetical protein